MERIPQPIMDKRGEVDHTETLDTRLHYADFLAKAEGGDCRIRLDNAQHQLDLARASSAIDIALPWGPARQADLEYQIHFARAACGSSA